MNGLTIAIITSVVLYDWCGTFSVIESTREQIDVEKSNGPASIQCYPEDVDGFNNLFNKYPLHVTM
jgi:hypothetical protein